MSKVILTEQALTATTTTLRHVQHESAQVAISYNERLIEAKSTYINWGSNHCTANAVEAALDWCKLYGVDQRSRLVISVKYKLEVLKQSRLRLSDQPWRYDPLQDPDWETAFGSKVLEECVVWRSDQHIDWERYEQKQQH